MASIAVAPAKIVRQTTHQVAGKLSITEHFFDVPKDHSKPEDGTIRIFARSARKHENPITPDSSKDKKLPWMIYLQGGPGLPCRSPQSYPWTQKMLDNGYQVLLLDPRGTGLSTPISASTLKRVGNVQQQVDYLRLFRADSIVRDAEAIRQALTAGEPEEKRNWSTVGQSFGGFCTLTYLSLYPQALRECFLFGGLAPLISSPDDVYKRLYKKVRERNDAYYSKYPEDVARVKQILDYLERDGDGNVILPSGGKMTRRRFLQMGLMFGFHGGIDGIHGVVLQASNDLEIFGYLTDTTLAALDAQDSFDNSMIYCILHESIYCQGKASNWAADRIRREYPEFDLNRANERINFTGEMVFPWMLDDYAQLNKVKEVGLRLAEIEDWPALYDEEQLAKNEVPVYAASYIHDMYVDQDLAMETARKVKNCKVFTTNVMFHNALGSKMEEVVQQLFNLRNDVFD